MQAAHHTSDQDHDAFEARISAWVDGQDDIRPEDVATPYGRRLWETYHLIGDVLRTDSLAVRPSPLFYARVSKAMDAEPAIVASTRWWSRRTAWSGLVVAAAVASVAWVALPYVMQTEDADAANRVVLASTGDDGSLNDYLQAHREIAGAGMIRRTSFGPSQP